MHDKLQLNWVSSEIQVTTANENEDVIGKAPYIIVSLSGNIAHYQYILSIHPWLTEITLSHAEFLLHFHR